jgi:hypothetical protein
MRTIYRLFMASMIFKELDIALLQIRKVMYGMEYYRLFKRVKENIKMDIHSSLAGTAKDVMIDLETLSTRNNAIILVIAGIKFRRNDPDIPLEKIPPRYTFYRKIDIDSCKEIGLHYDKLTEDWWKTQSEEVYNEAFLGDRIKIKQALFEFTQWFNQEPTGTKIWSQGANFDIPILDEAYRRCGLEPPWKFWLVRDTRTIYDIANIYSKDFPAGNEHNALSDCWRQIHGVKKAFKILKK